jgi:hypothetical protein
MAFALAGKPVRGRQLRETILLLVQKTFQQSRRVQYGKINRGDII